MPTRPRRIPSYTLHRPSGQARVRIAGKDIYLGAYGTSGSRAKYDRLIAEWLAAGRADGPDRPSTGTTTADLAIDELIAGYWTHCQDYYRAPDGRPGLELDNIRDALKPLRRLYGAAAARSFGPKALRAVRDELVRSGLARTTTSARINKVRRAFRWAASVELIPVEVPQALATVEGLALGRTAARDPEPVRPVEVERFEAILPHLPAPVAAMARGQLLSGCRVEEALAMRGCDLTPEGNCWIYEPPTHENA